MAGLEYEGNINRCQPLSAGVLLPAGILLLVVLVQILGNVPCRADNAVYQYRDEKGVRHFSDRQPDTAQPVEKRHSVGSTVDEYLSINAFEEEDRVQLEIANAYPVPVTVEIGTSVLENMVGEPPLPHRFVVASASRQPAVTLRVNDNNSEWRYRSWYRYCLGPPDPRHRPPGPYRLPFDPRRTFKVSQGFNGALSHQEKHSRYAVDMPMPIGTPIVCARDGIVAVVEEENVWGGDVKATFLDKINYIRILHDDGTMALYGHLRRGTSRVQPGDSVVAGQQISESGNTGYSSGPHLHFVVQRNSDLDYEAIPFQFLGPDGQGITPSKGATLGGW